MNLANRLVIGDDINTNGGSFDKDPFVSLMNKYTVVFDSIVFFLFKVCLNSFITNRARRTTTDQ